jgi:imidazolonepropionase-like amidohydrolase
LLCTLLPKARRHTAFCDTFCDEEALNVKQAEKIPKQAESLGFKLKISVVFRWPFV